MKNVIVILVLSLIVCGNVCAQNRTFRLKSGKTAQKQAIFIDLFPSMEGVWEGKAGAGLFYERRINSSFSVVGEANFYTDFKDETAYSFMGHGRYYPFKTVVGKLFTDVGFGYRSSSLQETTIEDVKCLEASASAGWKFILGKGFIIEPSFGYRRNIYTFSGDESEKGGVTINLGFGWAF